jgi:hypothetical protein
MNSSTSKSVQDSVQIKQKQFLGKNYESSTIQIAKLKGVSSKQTNLFKGKVFTNVSKAGPHRYQIECNAVKIGNALLHLHI